MRRLPGLDLLRAIAIVWVMLFHSYLVGGLGETFTGIQIYGWMGVDLFFALSGYLIGMQILTPLSRRESLDFQSFFVRRALRLLPTYIFVLALYFCLPGFREAEGIQPLWQFLTLTVNFFIDYEHNRAFSHVWSLCVEVHFYVAFALLAWWMAARLSVRGFLSVCVTLIAGGMILRAYVWHHMGTHFVEDIYYPTYTRLDGLIAGVAMAAMQVFRPVLWNRMQEKTNAAMLPAGLIVVALAIWVFQDRTGFVATVFGYPLLSWGLALLVAAGTAEKSYLARLRIPGVEWIALASYSLYLIHKAVFHFVQGILADHPIEHGLIVFAIYVATTLLAGGILYYCIERPFLTLRGHVLIRLRSQPYALKRKLEESR